MLRRIWNENLFIYEKKLNDEKILVILNLSEKEIEYDSSLIHNKEILISNYENIDNKLRPFEAIILRWKVWGK